MLLVTIGKKLRWKRSRNKKISELFRKEAILQFLSEERGVKPSTPDWDDDRGPMASEKE